MMKVCLFSINLCQLALISLLLLHASNLVATRNYLLPGESLSVEDPSDILKSPSGTFSCGFYNITSTAFTFSIWFSNSAEKTVVWSANSDLPVYGLRSSVLFNKDGYLILKNYEGHVIWSTNTHLSSTHRAELLDTGNLVIMDIGNNSLWQSFASPTDTLLPNQHITTNSKLTSAFRGLSSDYYRLSFEDSYLLSLKYVQSEISSIYWYNKNFSVLGMLADGTLPFLTTKCAVLDQNGIFLSSDGLTFKASDLGKGIWRRLTLDPDGNLRLYSLSEEDGTWSVSWMALTNPCDIHGFCGMNGLCVYAPTPTCTCPPGYQMSDPSNWSKGCRSTFQFDLSNTSLNQAWFWPLPGSGYWGSPIRVDNSSSLENCKDLCSGDSSCQAVQFENPNGHCYLMASFFNGKFPQGNRSDIYLKLSTSVKGEEASISYLSHPICSTTAQEVTIDSQQQSESRKEIWVYFYGFIIAVFVVEVVFISSGYWFIVREHKPSKVEEGYKRISNQSRRYSYKELEKATGKFKDVVGRGGSGIVYKGVLDDQRVVAVKKLEDASFGEEEFQAELSVIRRIYHKNLVRVWGFCSEQSYRILVYEFLENGSLDKVLFSANFVLGWRQRYKIALGVARGLAYLHHECLEWVLHCDVKPENILLGKDFKPQITDFGLAKLLNRGGENPNFSRIRGTRGYIAPEWACGLPITSKVDVYSYGVLLIELVIGVRVSDWVLNSCKLEVEMGLNGLVMVLKEKSKSHEPYWVADFADSRLRGQFSFSQAAAMVRLAIDCLEEDRNKRPSMNSVVQILHSLDLNANSKKYR
ncbi:Serine/threonine-protein kinase [Rhynchospora pubera]|uniref:Receptor-like serine/threonine-protein kinase n=1 Tax=Rhynchospora pubera TaxID=906938 RepID=A0AAV8DSX4_9POAL|nr:Serine/threonine-protein kinase [Rhynchospora pubera]